MLNKVSYGTIDNLLQYSKKLFCVLGTGILLSSCNSTQSFVANMAGTWKGETSGEGISYEQWNISDLKNEAYGTAWIMEDGDTVFIEKFELIQKDSGTFYCAYPNMTIKPTLFKLEKVSKNHLEVSNYKHDFPQVIIYHIKGDEVQITLKGENENHEKIEESYVLNRQPH